MRSFWNWHFNLAIKFDLIVDNAHASNEAREFACVIWVVGTSLAFRNAIDTLQPDSRPRNRDSNMNNAISTWVDTTKRMDEPTISTIFQVNRNLISYEDIIIFITWSIIQIHHSQILSPMLDCIEVSWRRNESTIINSDLPIPG